MIDTYSHFFDDFPELADRVAFMGDGERANRVLQKIKDLDLSAHGNILDITSQNEDRNFCLPVKIGDEYFFIINIADPYDFLATIHLPLFRRENDSSAFKEIIPQHEIGHIVISLLRPEALEQSQSMLLKSDRDLEREFFGERFSDTYMALKHVQARGQAGVDFVRRFSDLRILSALKKEVTSHLTYMVLDAVVERFPDGKALLGLTSLELAKLALEMVDGNNHGHKKMEEHLQQWKKALTSPSPDTLSHSSVRRLYLAIGNQLDIPLQDIEKAVAGYGFKPGDLKEKFVRSGALKAVVGLELMAGSPEDIKAVSGHIERLIFNAEANPDKYSNEYPGLGQFIRAATRSFAGGKYGLLCAASSPEFLNDLAHKHFMRQKILHLSEAIHIW